MSDSNEDEIIKRRRFSKTPSKKEKLTQLFDDEVSSSSESFVFENERQDNFFTDLFGTGKEYFYIFNSSKQKDTKENVVTFKKQEIISSVKNTLNMDGIEEIYDLYAAGYNIFYIFLYKTKDIDIYQFLTIYQCIINFINKTNFVFDRNKFNVFFDRIYNGSLYLCKEDTLISMTKDKSNVKGVVLDYFGNVIDKFSLNNNSMLEYVEGTNPKYIVVSGQNNSVRNLVQLHIRYRVYYMESKFYKDKSVYDRCTHVGRLSIFPEVEFMQFYRNLHFQDSDCSYYNVVYKEDKNHEDLSNIIKLAISTSMSVSKFDVNILLQHEDKYELIKFLGLEKCTRIFEYNRFDDEDEIRNVLQDVVLFSNFMTFFTLDGSCRNRPNFKGFPDNFIFKELINVEMNSINDLINKEVEGKIFYVDEYYVLANILNNVTCYIRTTDKYYINQIINVRITEINEPFLSFTGEISYNTKNVTKFIKHPLMFDLNSKDIEDKLRASNDLFLLRRSQKDGSIVLVLKFYNDIIVHVKLEDDYNNLDEMINRKVKHILRNVCNIRKYKYFYNNEIEALSKISVHSDYIKYGFYFTEEYPGKLCFIYNNKDIYKEYITVNEVLKYKNMTFKTIEDFVDYRKKI